MSSADPAPTSSRRIDTGAFTVLHFGNGALGIVVGPPPRSAMHFRPDDARRLAQILAEIYLDGDDGK